MTSLQVTLLALFGATALNWALHWYTQCVTYRLFDVIAAIAPGEGFVRYHRAYEARLVWSIYLPWSLLVGLSAAYFVRALSGLAGLLLALNLAIAGISVGLAVPIHRRIDRDVRLTGRDHVRLLRANLARLIVASASLALVAIEVARRL